MLQDITRGGQTLLHRFRMLRQVIKTSLLGSFITASAVFVGLCYFWVPAFHWQVWANYLEAYAAVHLLFLDAGVPIAQQITLADGRVVQTTAQAILSDTFSQQVHLQIWQTIQLSFIIGIFVLGGVLLQDLFDGGRRRGLAAKMLRVVKAP